jgi:hypothetical protein
MKKLAEILVEGGNPDADHIIYPNKPETHSGKGPPRKAEDVPANKLWKQHHENAVFLTRAEQEHHDPEVRKRAGEELHVAHRLMNKYSKYPQFDVHQASRDAQSHKDAWDHSKLGSPTAKIISRKSAQGTVARNAATKAISAPEPKGRHQGPAGFKKSSNGFAAAASGNGKDPDAVTRTGPMRGAWKGKKGHSATAAAKPARELAAPIAPRKTTAAPLKRHEWAALAAGAKAHTASAQASAPPSRNLNVSDHIARTKDTAFADSRGVTKRKPKDTVPEPRRPGEGRVKRKMGSLLKKG